MSETNQDPVAVHDLVQILDLERIEDRIFRGESPQDARQRVFGGQVAGQALVAATRTVDQGSVHSLHSYFLRPGDPSIPIVYEVERVRDGRSFSTRRVIAIQHGEAIFHLTASFHIEEPGFEFFIAPPEGVPAPESLPDFHTRAAPLADQLGDWYSMPRPIDFRYVGADEVRRMERDIHEERQLVWMRAVDRLPDDPVFHQCVLTYASDMTLLDTVVLPHGTSLYTDDVMAASLDHAMWFHRSFRADEWFLYVQDTVSTQNARGLARGLIYQNDALIVSVVQEGLVRPLK